MTTSVARQVTRAGTATLVAALLAVGVGTGALLHERQVRATDRTLLAAAHGHAHLAFAEDEEARVEHGPAPVETWWVEPDDARVSPGLRRTALDAAAPTVVDVGDDRIALLPVTTEDDDGPPGRRLVAARLPRPTLARTTGTFAVIYLGSALLVAALASQVLTRIVARAFSPVQQACDEAEAVIALGQGRRLTEDGPDEVRALLLAVNRLLDRLERAHEAQARFTAEAAHELRTPVAAMLGELDVTLRHPRSIEVYREALTSQREEVQRLARLVSGLTALAQLDAGAVERHRDDVHAEDLAREALSTERATLQAAGCEVRVEVQDDPELHVHRSLLVAALGNLLRNAARHAPRAPVVLRVRQHGDEAWFEVDDAGPGVPAEEREAVFGRFVRTGEARVRDTTGLGLGLPLAREVARRHGGDVTLHEAPTGGTRARLTVRRGGPGPSEA